MKNKGLIAALVLTAVFIAAEALVFYWKGGYTMTLVPLALLVVWLFVVRLETGLLLMALCTPFAINMALMPGMELSMPVEPMMILFTLIFFFRVLLIRRSEVGSRRYQTQQPTPDSDLQPSTSFWRSKPFFLAYICSPSWKVSVRQMPGKAV